VTTAVHLRNWCTTVIKDKVTLIKFKLSRESQLSFWNTLPSLETEIHSPAYNVITMLTELIRKWNLLETLLHLENMFYSFAACVINTPYIIYSCYRRFLIGVLACFYTSITQRVCLLCWVSSSYRIMHFSIQRSWHTNMKFEWLWSKTESLFHIGSVCFVISGHFTVWHGKNKDHRGWDIM